MSLVIDPLLGKDFDMHRQNCLHTVRGFFELNSPNIRISDWACPEEWWLNGLDLFRDLALEEGFKLFDGPPSEFQVGDVPLMALGSTVGNHIGVIVPNNRMLHHMMGTRSCVHSYGGSFRNNTVAVFRHPAFSFEHVKTTATISELLRPYERSKLEKYLAR